MKNFKLLAVVAVVLVAGSAFAFFNGETKPVKKVLTKQTYYHIGNQYVPMSSPPAGLSCRPDDFYCTVEIEGASDDLPGTFDETAIPTADPNLIVTTSNASRSWK